MFSDEQDNGGSVAGLTADVQRVSQQTRAVPHGAQAKARHDGGLIKAPPIIFNPQAYTFGLLALTDRDMPRVGVAGGICQAFLDNGERVTNLGRC